MNQDQRYAPFRPELTTAHKERIRKAANQTDEYARIAIEEAKAQLSLAENTPKKRNALPDNEGVCLRIPDVDPRGQYSILDMRALQRIQEIDAAVVDMDLALQALEHFLDIRPGETPAEVEQFCRDRLGVTFTPEQRTAARQMIQPEEATILFANFENVLLQVLFAMPENWELTIEELEALRDEE